jgi:IS66 Orf2 like protein
MIALRSDVRVYLACGYTDMRKGMQGLAMLVQQVLAEDPFICVGADYVAGSQENALLHSNSQNRRHIRCRHLRLELAHPDAIISAQRAIMATDAIMSDIANTSTQA